MDKNLSALAKAKDILKGALPTCATCPRGMELSSFAQSRQCLAMRDAISMISMISNMQAREKRPLRLRSADAEIPEESSAPLARRAGPPLRAAGHKGRTDEGDG